MKQFLFSIVLLGSCVINAGSDKKEHPVKEKMEPIARWSGTIQLEETVIFNNLNLRGKGERHMSASFINALPTLYRDDESTDLNFTDDKGTGNHSFNSKTKFLNDKGELISEGCTDCQGSGQAELHSVVVREWDNTYDIEVIPPACTGTNCDGTTYGPETNSITIGSHPLKNRDILDGSITRTGKLVGDYGTFTTTIIWHFERVKEDDVELIVTPLDYDNWLPEPGKDELTRGKVMTVNLKLQGKNGKPLKAKVESFELRLNNTSIEPGITINYPVEPDPNQLPDLRFLLHPSIESLDPDQFVSIGSPDGITGKAMIASYDGGGWSILTAEAILKDGRHIQGRLLKPGGEIDIRIPKRDPNSHIGEAWLIKYGNPGEMDDLEKSNGNNFKGDGLTAYEEYRGVVSLSKFKRLEPTKKEVGVVARLKDFSLFGTGIGWFETASDLKVIRFDYEKDETWWDGRLNRNAKTSHDFDQNAIYLADGSIGGRTLGICHGKRIPWIPANITGVIIDWAAIQSAYQNRINEAKPQTPKFSLQEYLAQTVAHELGHAVNIDHHGTDKTYRNPVKSTDSVYDRNRRLITPNPDTLYNVGPRSLSVEGGDMSCMLNYYPFYSWGYKVKGNIYIYNQEPLLPIGRIFCTDKKGTGINATQLYFGDASAGNCLSVIQLRN